jgi:hypothetical protein
MKEKTILGICNCGHELVDRVPEPSIGCTICKDDCQRYIEKNK